MNFPKTFLTVVIFLFATTLLSADDYRLKPGDILDVQIINRRELNTKQPITPSGTISLPLIGRISVQDKTLSELDNILTSQFTKYIQPAQVLVLLEKTASKINDSDKTIYVTLQDIGKNTLEVKKTENASEALAYTLSQPFTLQRRMVDGSVSKMENTVTTNILGGDILTVKIGKEPDFIKDNWYHFLSGAALALGILNSLK